MRGSLILGTAVAKQSGSSVSACHGVAMTLCRRAKGGGSIPATVAAFKIKAKSENTSVSTLRCRLIKNPRGSKLPGALHYRAPHSPSVAFGVLRLKNFKEIKALGFLFWLSSLRRRTKIAARENLPMGPERACPALVFTAKHASIAPVLSSHKCSCRQMRTVFLRPSSDLVQPKTMVNKCGKITNTEVPRERNLLRYVVAASEISILVVSVKGLLKVICKYSPYAHAFMFFGKRKRKESCRNYAASYKFLHH